MLVPYNSWRKSPGAREARWVVQRLNWHTCYHFKHSYYQKIDEIYDLVNPAIRQRIHSIVCCETELELIKELKNQNKKICGYAATSKSTTVLNYCQIGANLIECIYDTTKEKIGKFSPGRHIPIVLSENFKINKPDISYLFAWNHKEEIFKKEKDFLSYGGKWISHVNI